MLLLSFLILFAGVIYVALILFFYQGWKKMGDFVSSEKREIGLSVIVPFRNEESNLGLILRALQNQTYSKKFFEVIFINDHSTDDSVAVIESFPEEHFNMHLIHLNEGQFGKKAAIREGIKKAREDILLTLDSDCIPAGGWLETMASFYSKYRSKLVIGPVLMNKPGSFATKLMDLEFASLAAVTAGSAGNGTPLMCNGANLLFERKVVNDISDIYETSIPSGDDMFLLQEVKKQYREGIEYCKSRKAAVYAKPPETLPAFIHQRVRWTSKSKYYNDREIKGTALLVFIVNFLLAGSFVSSFFSLNGMILFLALFTMKSIADYVLLHSFTRYFRLTGLLKLSNYLPAQILYPFYVVFVSIKSQAGYYWKGRYVKSLY